MSRKRPSLYTPEYRRQRQRQAVGWIVVAIGVVIGVTHVFRHLGAFRFLPGSGWQELATGYPLAAVFVASGFAMILRHAA